MSNITGAYFSQDSSNSEKLIVKRFVAFYVISIIEASIGIGGNGLFLLSLIKIKNAKSNMYVIMSSLAVADFINSLLFYTETIRDFVVKSYQIQYEFC